MWCYCAGLSCLEYARWRWRCKEVVVRRSESRGCNDGRAWGYDETRKRVCIIVVRKKYCTVFLRLAVFLCLVSLNKYDGMVHLLLLLLLLLLGVMGSDRFLSHHGLRPSVAQCSTHIHTSWHNGALRVCVSAQGRGVCMCVCECCEQSLSSLF